MRIFFSVGEPSGDLHGANLIRQLLQRNPDLECCGFGGPRMKSAGCDLHQDLTQLAVMGVTRVLALLPKFWNLFVAAKRYFRDHRPDAVVLIDYPGFNWWVARAAKKYGIPVFYYGAPQMWGWGGWRIRKMRRLVQHVLCKLPFEAEWYQQRGCDAVYVGHPYFDEMESQQLDTDFIEQQRLDSRRLIGILPGSRTQEVAHNLKWFLKAAVAVHQECPDVRFAVAAFSEKHAITARDAVAHLDLPIEVHVGRTPEIIHVSHSCMACSGSVSLELLHHRKPTVILYWVNAFVYHVLRRLIARVKYITLVNLLASENPFLARGEQHDPVAASSPRVLFPEIVTYQDRSQDVANLLMHWLRDEAAYEHRIEQLASLRSKHGRAGASVRAAEYILRELNADQPRINAPHFDVRKLQKKGRIRT